MSLGQVIPDRSVDAHRAVTCFTPPTYLALRERDAARRKHLQEIVASEGLEEPNDYYNAAWILNAKCVELGGAVIARPRAMGSQGRYCVVRDPAGAVAAFFEQAS